jgi:hypothetical protein
VSSANPALEFRRFRGRSAVRITNVGRKLAFDHNAIRQWSQQRIRISIRLPGTAYMRGDEAEMVERLAHGDFECRGIRLLCCLPQRIDRLLRIR